MRSFWKTFSMMCYFATLISVKFEWIDEGETRRVRSHANAWMFLNDFNDAVIQWTYGTVKNWGFLKGSRMLLCNANVPAQPVGNLSRNSIKKKKAPSQSQTIWTTFWVGYCILFERYTSVIALKSVSVNVTKSLWNGDQNMNSYKYNYSSTWLIKQKPVHLCKYKSKSHQQERLHVYNLRPICYDTGSKSGGGCLGALGTPMRTAPQDLAICSPRLPLTRPRG